MSLRFESEKQYEEFMRGRGIAPAPPPPLPEPPLRRREQEPYCRMRSQLERDFGRHLEAEGLLPGRDWRYEEQTLRLGDQCRYTPDFWVPGRDAYYEVKGSWKARGAAKSRAKLKSAANKFPWFVFYAVTRVGTEWVFEEIKR